MQPVLLLESKATKEQISELADGGKVATRWKSKDTALQPCKHTCSDRNCFGFVLLVTLL